VLAVAQDVHSYPPYKDWASYRFVPLAMLAVGYAF